MVLHQKIKWSIDPDHSSIHFKVRHMMIAHIRGEFRQFDASIHITNNDFTTAEIDFRIEASSIYTGNAERDEHLRSADGREISGFQAEAKINRTDWGMLFNAPLETGGVMVGKQVHISCEIELIAENKEVHSMELNRSR